MSTKRKTMLLSVLAIVLVLAVVVGSRLRETEGTWYLHSAPLPQDWPALTPLGQVRVKEYPSNRIAEVTAGRTGGGEKPLFGALFDHIKSSDIAMTAPVEMGYTTTPEGERQLDVMAFLYRSPQQGQAGEDGAVHVLDRAAQTHASVGVRGNYGRETFETGWAALEAWLAASPEWEVAGAPRYLGYNGPFVPPFFRYGEVVVPVRSRAGESLSGSREEPL